MQWRVWNFLASHPEKTSRELCTALKGDLHSVSSLLVQGERRGIYSSAEQYDTHAKRKLKRYSVAPKWKDRFPEAREAPLKKKAGMPQPPSSGIFVTTEPIAFTTEKLESEELKVPPPISVKDSKGTTRYIRVLPEVAENVQRLMVAIRQLPFDEVVQLRQEINKLFQG